MALLKSDEKCSWLFVEDLKILNTLNTGSVKELQRLQTIGAKRAELILNYRKRVGLFRQVNGQQTIHVKVLLCQLFLLLFHR